MIDAEDLAVAMARLWTRVQVAELGPDDPRMRAAKRAAEEHFVDAMKALPKFEIVSTNLPKEQEEALRAAFGQ